MAEFVIQAGAKVDLATRAEMREDIHHAMQATESERLRARARGFVPLRLSGNIGGKTSFLLDAVPESGYVFNVKMLAVQLSGNGTILAYISSSSPATGATPQRLVGIGNLASSANQIITWSSSQFLLFADESIYITASGANLNTYFLAAMQVPAEMVFKAYD